MIRFATSADAGLIHGFICELAEYERSPGMVRVTEARLAEQLAAPVPPFECLLADAAEGAVGFALFYQSYSTWCGSPGLYLEDLFVRPEARGRGHGRALIQRLARIARERGYERMDWAVLDWNVPAIEFYRRLGAARQSEWQPFRLSGEALERLARDP